MGMPKRHGDLDRKCEQGAPRTKLYVRSKPAHPSARLKVVPVKSVLPENSAKAMYGT
jgi:hypothetical protein